MKGQINPKNDNTPQGSGGQNTAQEKEEEKAAPHFNFLLLHVTSLFLLAEEGWRRRQYHPRGENSTTPMEDGTAAPTKAAPAQRRGRVKAAPLQRERRRTKEPGGKTASPRRGGDIKHVKENDNDKVQRPKQQDTQYQQRKKQQPKNQRHQRLGVLTSRCP